MAGNPSAAVGGRFEPIRPLGAGMAEVYAAVDLLADPADPDREVALKLVTLDRSRARGAEPGFKRLIERFKREIDIMGRLDHPGVPRLIASGYDEDRHQPYLAMRLLHGITLGELIAEGGALPVRAVAGIAGQIAEALTAAHTADVLHRDLKPANVMLERDGRVMVLDFGVGLLIGPDAPERLTSTGAAVGTHQYMSPEQATGGELTAGSDLYNLGCLLYELLSGTPPFPEGTDQQILLAHLQSEPARLDLMRGDLPAELSALVAELLAKEPAERPADARAVAARLRAIADAAPRERLPAALCEADPADLLAPAEPADEQADAQPAGPSARFPAPTEETDASMNVFQIHRKLIDEYERFTTGGVVIADPRVKNFVEEDMRAGTQWPDPFVALNPFFESGGRVDELAAQGLLHPECANIFQTGKVEGAASCEGTPITLHRHQRDAIEAAGRGESYVLTTGTGSGKSLAYIVPIVDKVLRERAERPGSRGIRAIVVYPMNALANSQQQELEKFLAHGYPEGGEPVTFARYTGQENDSKREQIRKNPPDILLTNYVMLEMLLTRPEERQKLIGAARGLRFLVFDELHTYRGRQGADVAWLIRRVREACDAPDVQCIGTSATMATEGTLAEQRDAVAEVATGIFGLDRPPRVIGETLVRACTGEAAAVTVERIAAPAAPARYEDLAADPLAAWIEQRFGLRTDDATGTLVRQSPTTVEAAAETLAAQTDADEEACKSAIRKTLLAGSAAKHPETGRPLFAFRLHQFLSKGDHVYTTAEGENVRKLTRDYQVVLPGTADKFGRGKRLYPLAFCRDCGQEYLTVVRTADTRTGRPEYKARIDNDVVEDDHVQTGYLYIDTERPWSADTAELIEAGRLPESWLETDASGNRVLAKSKIGKVPRAVQVDPTGIEGSGVDAAFVSGRFTFCLACGITYEGARGKDFGRLAAFNQEGRSSATSVVSANILESLRSTALSDRAKKLLAFVDNRQDAALQAGHLNDFARVVQLRGALYRALKQAEGGLNDEEVAAAVVAQMGLDVSQYAKAGKDLVPSMARLARSTFEAVVNLHLHVDLRRGWRVTMPNLEQTGQLVLDYHDLDLIAGGDWSGCHSALADADAQTRRGLLKTLLDAMRRSLAIEADCLDGEGFDSLQRGSWGRLSESWRLDETEDKPEQATVYPMPEPRGSDKTCAFMSGRSKMGRHVADVLGGREGRLATEERQEIIHDMLRTLARYGLVSEVPPPRRSGRGRGPRRPDATGYRVNAAAFLWKAGDGSEGIDDPLNVSRKQGRPPVHTYFRDLYDSPASALANLRAKEHTAQVSSAEREIREGRFRSAELPLLYCSPTMELGVDIAELNAVMMRNVPPTPANYAQRSGRAGRSGQQALVVTYCATGNSHDQYYFDRREQMAAGAVTPPRIDLCNRDLITAHLHAIWLAQLDDFKLGHSVTDLVKTDALEGDDPDFDAELPLHGHVRQAIESKTARARTLQIARGLLRELEPELAKTTWWVPEWLEKEVEHIPDAFDHAFERWRSLYCAAKVEREEQHRRQDDTSLTQRDRRYAGNRRREAEGQLSLLRNESGGDYSFGADFYPHRYLASEGFLPGYSFPRLPLAAYIPNRAGTGDEGDYLQRARFLAIREFGPDALIYHEGRRYQVKRIQLPPNGSGDLTLTLTKSKRCPVCGCGHDTRDNADTCTVCHTRLPNEGRGNLLELRTVYTTRRERISSDEEERRRSGYLLETSYRFNDKGAQKGRVDSEILGQGGKLGRIAYGDAATVRVANIRRRIADRDEPDGYWLDPATGHWISKKQADDAVDDASELSDADTETRLRKRVVPYVEDTRNIAVLSLDHAVDADTALSLMYALERGIEAEFQLEDSELASELPTGNDDHTGFLLFVESAEGGAGVLRRLQREPGDLARAARKALEICHFDPETGADRASEECAKGCYKCLLSYGNQIVHDRIDRHAAKELLLQFSRADVRQAAPGESRTDEHRRLEQGTDSSLERDLLAMLKAEGHRLPQQTQVLIESCHARPDFVYYTDGGTYAVFVDGPVHDRADVALRDAEAEARLIDAGWMTIRFRYDEDWHDVIARHRDVFGPGRSTAAPREEQA